MQAIRPVLLLVLAAALLPAGSAAAGGGARHTKAQAEANVLNAPARIARLDRSLFDARTNLVRSNSTSRCTGRGRALHGGWSSFVCSVANGKKHVRFVYVAASAKAFLIRPLSS